MKTSGLLKTSGIKVRTTIGPTELRRVQMTINDETTTINGLKKTTTTTNYERRV